MKKLIFFLIIFTANVVYAMEYENDEGGITQVSFEEMMQLEKKAREISDDYKKLVAVFKKKSKYCKDHEEALSQAEYWERIADLQEQSIRILKDLERLLNEAERKIPTQS